MANPVSTSWGIFSFIKFGVLAIFIGLLVIESIYIGFHEGSIAPVIKTVGARLTQSTVQLSKASQEVIANGRIYDSSQGLVKGVWGFLKINYVFFMSFYILYLWIWIFAWVIGRSPVSNRDATFNNYFMATILFFVIQGMFLMAMAGIDKNIDCFSNCDGKGAIDYLLSPLTAFIQFFKALGIVLQPGFATVNKINNMTNGT